MEERVDVKRDDDAFRLTVSLNPSHKLEILMGVLLI